MRDDLLETFLDGELDPASFTHRTHVRLTYLLLLDRPLPETLVALRDGLVRLATRAGHPEKYHETITFAFAALINERMQRSSKGWEAFELENADLFQWGSGSLLDRLYPGQTLATDEAKRVFLLPRALEREDPLGRAVPRAP